jgi:hypothetical protein
MLSGFPLDHWNHASIQSTIGSFGCVILWENDLDYRARLLVRARVTELEEVIHYIMISESNDLIGQSWMVQCEILEHRMLGVLLLMRSSSLFLKKMVTLPLLISLVLGSLHFNLLTYKI